MPRYDWMEELVENITKNIVKIFNYAKKNLNTQENIEKIKEITNLIRNDF